MPLLGTARGVDQTAWIAAMSARLGTTFAFSVCMAAPAALAPARSVCITAGVLLALGYGEATLGPLALATGCRAVLSVGRKAEASDRKRDVHQPKRIRLLE
jgi:hypothetical protein